MKHLLPPLNQLIETDFLIVDRDNPFIDSNPAILVLKTEQHYFTTAAAYPLNWQKTTAINDNSEWNDAICTECNVVLYEDNQGQVSGYIRSAALINTLFSCYQHLLAYFETTLKTTDLTLTIIDDNEKVAVWTDGAEQIFSIPREHIIGKPATDYFNPDMLQVLKTLRTGKSVIKHQHQPREDLFVLINARPIILHDNIIGAVSAETDITAQIRLLQELFHMTHKVEQLHINLQPKEDPFLRIKGTSKAVKQCKETIQKISATKATVLISGESGTGKELFARAIHDCSKQQNEPFIAINCGAIPPSLFESELFGYEGGAFSGADPKGKKGKFELAGNGTLFLDEIAEMPLDMQVKLLRVLQEKSFFRIGGMKLLQANCRIIAATNRNLEEMLQKETFREDLYYRLNVLSLEIPPLRERKEDVFELIQSFLHEFSILHQCPVQSFPYEVLQTLIQYNWPGNIRELRNIIERLVILAPDGIIRLEHLPASIYQTTIPDASLSLQEQVDRYEKVLLLEALRLENGNKSALAKRLGLSRATIYNKLKRLGI